ncbi:molybdopterin-guanine dinucleotide biosynthesis protein B [Peribacillus cavernae]|uniref:Molybdopterin-guanine dinucleotide biosynthesis protein B n=1 Tax=Peribacillus cavernae TaxID=1674310 RepID=A0A433HBP1_9BACI|nr:molybdopterin-guanine dinucleotide biosynthesis protein B [Peribacillus cavernae]MDQ0220388.1 molybdopterin-guanine dinucleotide biosynthesis protein B [Peribacillus cavernae]RUQ25525.1 molybdopterin-guanine dinucleotide biosynthesis protein B [Peribacillus cavernae]
MVTPVLFQITGYQNTGKTTVIINLIEYLKSAGFAVSVLKHHGHGTPDLPDKDSARHFKAGAGAALVEGNGTIQLHASLSDEETDSIEKLLEILNMFNPDIVLIEGYKNKPFPKAVIIKEENDLVLLKSLRNIHAVLCWPEVAGKVHSLNLALPVFEINSSEFHNWFLQHYKIMG